MTSLWYNEITTSRNEVILMSHRLTCRLDESVFAQLKYIAEKKHCSLNQALVDLILKEGSDLHANRSKQ